MNLIVDEGENQVTGNSVGKTTVLKLIDFCFGADKRSIYADPENKRQECRTVRDFLVNEKILITLVLSRSVKNMTDDITIERNFPSSRQEAIRRINERQYAEKDFEPALQRLIFPDLAAKHPSFRQIISHNFRYRDESLNNTLKTLNKYAPDVVYETLYLYLFGCDFDKADAKQDVFAYLQQEETFRKRLEKNQTKTGYETTLALVEGEIERLNERKSDFSLNENFESDLQELNRLKYEVNKLSSDILALNIRKDLIVETREELSSGITNMEIEPLRVIYTQAKNNISAIHKTFEDLVHFHNRMIREKINFITRDLPRVEEDIAVRSRKLGEMLVREKTLTLRIAKSDSFEELENTVAELNDKYRRKGEYEAVIRQINEKELMDDKQLVKIADFVNEHDIQFVASILKDKLPPELDDEDYFVVKLSQADKLFRIENTSRKA
jgi:uncharacterized protein YydD (DUF2326 family)